MGWYLVKPSDNCTFTFIKLCVQGYRLPSDNTERKRITFMLYHIWSLATNRRSYWKDTGDRGIHRCESLKIHRRILYNKNNI